MDPPFACGASHPCLQHSNRGRYVPRAAGCGLWLASTSQRPLLQTKDSNSTSGPIRTLPQLGLTGLGEDKSTQFWKEARPWNPPHAPLLSHAIVHCCGGHFRLVKSHCSAVLHCRPKTPNALSIRPFTSPHPPFSPSRPRPHARDTHKAKSLACGPSFLHIVSFPSSISPADIFERLVHIPKTSST